MVSHPTPPAVVTTLTCARCRMTLWLAAPSLAAIGMGLVAAGWRDEARRVLCPGCALMARVAASRVRPADDEGAHLDPDDTVAF